MASGSISAACPAPSAVGKPPRCTPLPFLLMQNENIIPTLLIVGFVFVVGGLALLSAKAALVAAGLVFLVTAWSLLRGGR